MKFHILQADKRSKARTGYIVTNHGNIPTPVFMPVGTTGTVKGVHQRELVQDIEAKIILGNAYHLYLRPGVDILKKARGIHGFSSWEMPVLTDSGGYQVYSLAEKRSISEDGVAFQSHIDGSTHIFTPEKVVDIQRSIGSDIMMAFDECPPYPCSHDYAQKSMTLTHHWLDRCITRMHHTKPLYGHDQALFGIVQGGIFKDLRKDGAEHIASLELAGNAIGGLSVGEPIDIMYEITAQTCSILPTHKPRYLMGVGTPQNILECIALGVDMFDCVMPTRNARNGMLFTTQGIINIRNKKWKNDMTQIDTSLGGYVSTHYTKAYLRHLIISKEILGAQIASIHNLTFYLWLLKKARDKIMQGNFTTWKNCATQQFSQRL